MSNHLLHVPIELGERIQPDRQPVLPDQRGVEVTRVEIEVGNDDLARMHISDLTRNALQGGSWRAQARINIM